MRSSCPGAAVHDRFALARSFMPVPLPRSAPAVALGALACLALAGCAPEGVSKYTAPRNESRSLPESAKVRLLGAIIPFEQHTWYFKLIVQESALSDAQEEAVRTFIETATFPRDGEEVRWKLPE